jgi:hypothetical protein
VPGFDRLTIDVIIAETGADMTRFPTAADLASCSGVCPGSHESAGKRRNVSTIPGNQWLRTALIESARAAVRTKGSYFGAQYRQIARRRGPNKAAVAVVNRPGVVGDSWPWKVKDGVHAIRTISWEADDAAVLAGGEAGGGEDGPLVAGRDRDDARSGPEGR